MKAREVLYTFNAFKKVLGGLPKVMHGCLRCFSVAVSVFTGSFSQNDFNFAFSGTMQCDDRDSPSLRILTCFS